MFWGLGYIIIFRIIFRIIFTTPTKFFALEAGELTKEKFFPNKTVQHFGLILGKTKMFTFPKSDLS